MRLQHFAGAVAVALALCAVDARAQSEPPFPAHDRSSPTELDRYEVVQAVYAARFTFMVDRFDGAVWVLVTRQDSTFRWQPLPDPPHPPKEIRNAGRVNYQLFVSGISARWMFLVNVNDGATWNLRTDDRGDFIWMFVN